jgi:hypothetical protein
MQEKLKKNDEKLKKNKRKEKGTKLFTYSHATAYSYYPSPPWLPLHCPQC